MTRIHSCRFASRYFLYIPAVKCILLFSCLSLLHLPSCSEFSLSSHSSSIVFLSSCCRYMSAFCVSCTHLLQFGVASRVAKFKMTNISRWNDILTTFLIVLTLGNASVMHLLLMHRLFAMSCVVRSGKLLAFLVETLVVLRRWLCVRTKFFFLQQRFAICLLVWRVGVSFTSAWSISLLHYNSLI